VPTIRAAVILLAARKTGDGRRRLRPTPPSEEEHGTLRHAYANAVRIDADGNCKNVTPNMGDVYEFVSNIRPSPSPDLHRRPLILRSGE
jgi:hypothetical protein